jgi:hypothetical protein
MQSNDTPTCRYCLEASGTLLSPCKCRGTQGYIHLVCQQDACNATNTYSCPVCLSQFTNIIIQQREYIEEDEWTESLCSSCIRYMTPILHIITSTILTSSISSFAYYTIVWQTLLGCSLIVTNYTYRVKNRRMYIQILCTSFYNNYILLHACILLYLYIMMQYTKSITYYLLLLSSISLIHTYESQHIHILRQINKNIDASDMVLFIPN